MLSVLIRIASMSKLSKLLHDNKDWEPCHDNVFVVRSMKLRASGSMSGITQKNLMVPNSDHWDGFLYKYYPRKILIFHVMTDSE